MTKVVRAISLGEGKTRYVVSLYDIESKVGSEISRRRMEFLNEIVVDGVYTGLLNCGSGPFQKMSMWHDACKWIIQLEGEEQA